RELLWWLAAGFALCLCSACSCNSSQTPSRTESEDPFPLLSTVESAAEGQYGITPAARAGGGVADEQGALGIVEPMAGTVAEEKGAIRAAEYPGGSVSAEEDSEPTTQRRAKAGPSPWWVVLGLVLSL
ncbi:hypothetical protein CSUI_007904, partial [Cystoisospora suis]